MLKAVDQSPEQLLLPSQVAEILRLSKDTLTVWRSTGRYPLKYVKMGGSVRYRPADVKEFIDQRVSTSASGLCFK